MQITVSGKQIDLSDALRTHVAQHLDVITGKYFDHALEANVTFSRARSFFTCDINIHAARGLTLRGEGEAGDAHAAFDDAAEHIAKRLRRYRRRMNGHSRETANRERPEMVRQFVLREVYESEQSAAEAASNGSAEVYDALSHHAAVVAETQTEIRHLTVGEAVMRMDLANQSLLLFREASTGALNIVYRRPDQHIGWIDTSTI